MVQQNKQLEEGEAEYSHWFVLKFPPSATGQIDFPGAEHYPFDSVGLARSPLARERSIARRTGDREKLAQATFRDYPDKVLTEVPEVHRRAPLRLGTKCAFVIGLRNTGNQPVYGARIDDKWYRPGGDTDPPDHFPVLVVPRESRMHICPFGEAKHSGHDLAAGVPVVIDGKAQSRASCIMLSSDAAHWAYVDPNGRFGPPAPAWAELSNLWQELDDRGASEAEMAHELDALVREHNGIARAQGRETIEPPAGPALPHSVLALRGGSVHAIVVSGSMWDIGKLLEKSFEQAFIVDQSGSVRYSFLEGDKVKPLVGTPNWRDKGTAFLAVRSGGWIRSVPHFPA